MAANGRSKGTTAVKRLVKTFSILFQHYGISEAGWPENTAQERR